MKTAEIKPGIFVTWEMFEKARKALAEQTPLPPLTWEEFSNKKNWRSIPNRKGELYKIEWVIHRDNGKLTVKFNLWVGEDIRDGDKPKPHNHPWKFTSFILFGKGYKQAKWVVKNGKAIRTEETCRLGERNNLNTNEYHEVFELLSEMVLTLMVTGPVDFSRRWGYLDLDNVKHINSKDWEDPNFKQNMARLNS